MWQWGIFAVVGAAQAWVLLGRRNSQPAKGAAYQYLSRPWSYTDQPNKSFLSRSPARIGVIGGSLCGCIVAKTLVQQGYNVQVIEARPTLNADYSSAFIWPPPDLLGIRSNDRMEYLRAYVQRFSLANKIRMDCRVLGVRQDESGEWHVITNRGDLSYDFLVFATGFKPTYPRRPLNIWSNLTSPIEFWDDRKRNYKVHAGKNVVVIGPQETAGSEVIRLCAAGAKVTLIASESEAILHQSPISDFLRYRRIGEYWNQRGFVRYYLAAAVDAVVTFVHNKGVPEECAVASFAAAELSATQAYDYRPWLTTGQLRIVRGEVTSTESHALLVGKQKVHCDVLVLTPKLEQGFREVLGLTEEEVLYRNTLVPGVQNAAVVGLFGLPQRPVLTNLQAKWLLDVLRGRVVLPDADYMREAALTPATGIYATADSFLADCGINAHRRGWDWVAPFNAEDYVEVVTHSR